MRWKRLVLGGSIAVAAPVLLAAIAVAAGYVLPGRIHNPPAWYYDLHPDRLTTVVNAAFAAVAAGAATFLIPLRPRLRGVIAVLASLVSLPVYVLVWLGTFQVVEWLGLGWASTY